MKFSRMIPLIYLSFGIANNSVASNLESHPIDTVHKQIIVGTIPAQEVQKQFIKYLESHPEYKDQLSLIQKSKPTVPPYIKLLKLAPNPNYNPNSKTYDSITLAARSYPSSRTLNLISPVLNQGDYGTCVTFGVLGAIAEETLDGVPSTSCALQLLNSNGQNAWYGYLISEFFPYIQTYGWISQATGQNGYCNPTYPTYYPQASYADQTQAKLVISNSTYSSSSAKIMNGYYHEQYLSDGNSALNYIKQELNDTSIPTVDNPGFYPVFGFYMQGNPILEPVYFNGQPGPIYPVWEDLGSHSTTSGHVLFAYGYDDNASVDGQQGILYLRNSWGTAYNTSGNYVMTYQYFINNFENYEPIVSFPSMNKEVIR